MYLVMSLADPAARVRMSWSGRIGSIHTPSLVTMPVVPSQPVNRPSSLGNGMNECQESEYAADPTFTTSAVGRTTSMLERSWLLMPLLPDSWPPMPWFIAMARTEADDGPTPHPNSNPLENSRPSHCGFDSFRARENWPCDTPGSITAQLCSW